MLLELRVENYAVIDNVAVEFAAGLNLLTGETGAGKSILIDALALLLGDKASSDAVRHGTDKADCLGGLRGRVARRSMRSSKRTDIDAEDGQIILRREIAAGGKGRVFINNQPATVTVLKQLAPHLAVIHAQNEAVLAFDAASRLALLDTFAGSGRLRRSRRPSSNGTRCAIASPTWSATSPTACGCWTCGTSSAKRLPTRACSRKKTRSWKPRSACWPTPSACATLRWRPTTRSTRATRRRRRSIRAATRQIEELSRFDEQFRDAVPELESARIAIEDIGRGCAITREGIEASPERLAEVEDRLAALDRLKRKYGPTLDDVIALGAELERKLNEMENKDEVLRKLRLELASGCRAVSGGSARACRGSDTKRRASWRSWSRAKSTSWR